MSSVDQGTKYRQLETQPSVQRSTLAIDGQGVLVFIDQRRLRRRRRFTARILVALSFIDLSIAKRHENEEAQCSICR